MTGFPVLGVSLVPPATVLEGQKTPALDQANRNLGISTIKTSAKYRRQWIVVDINDDLDWLFDFHMQISLFIVVPDDSDVLTNFLRLAAYEMLWVRIRIKYNPASHLREQQQGISAS